MVVEPTTTMSLHHLSRFRSFVTWNQNGPELLPGAVLHSQRLREHATTTTWTQCKPPSASTPGGPRCKDAEIRRHSQIVLNEVDSSLGDIQHTLPHQFSTDERETCLPHVA